MLDAPLLVADDLSLSYGETRALVSASVQVHAGEVLALMGPSGSGKSTLMHCLAGILAPDSSTVTDDGRDVTTMSDVERSALRRTELGVVFQFGQLVPELTCLENVALPLRMTGTRRREPSASPRGGWSAWRWTTSPASAPVRPPAARASGSPSPAPS